MPSLVYGSPVFQNVTESCMAIGGSLLRTASVQRCSLLAIAARLSDFFVSNSKTEKEGMEIETLLDEWFENRIVSSIPITDTMHAYTLVLYFDCKMLLNKHSQSDRAHSGLSGKEPHHCKLIAIHSACSIAAISSSSAIECDRISRPLVTAALVLLSALQPKTFIGTDTPFYDVKQAFLRERAEVLVNSLTRLGYGNVVARSDADKLRNLLHSV